MPEPGISRRSFLQKAALFGVGAMAVPLVYPSFSFAAEQNLQRPQLVQQSLLLMGTIVTISVAANDTPKAEAGINKAFEEMRKLIPIFDRRDQNSALAILNKQGSLQDVPAELLLVLSTSVALEKSSHGLFTPAIAPLTDLLAGKATIGRKIHIEQQEVAEALDLAKPGGISVQNNRVSLDRANMALTLDSIAKGYIADKASAILVQAGLVDHMVNAGGDIRCSGSGRQGKPWVIGIATPAKGSQRVLRRTVEAANAGIATSGWYERSFDANGTLHHILNPITGLSPAVASVTVKAPTALEADAQATILSLMPPAEALRHAESLGLGCLIIDRSGTIYTKGI